MYGIPEHARKMAEQMGIPADKKEQCIHRISRSLFEKNRDQMRRVMEQQIDAANPKAEYCSMTAMILGIMDVRKLVVGGADKKIQSLYDNYFVKMLEVRKKAEEIEKTDYAKGIEYRAKMATKWSEIVRAQINTEGSTIDDIENAHSVHDIDPANLHKVQNNVQARSGTILAKKLDEFDTMARRKDTP